MPATESTSADRHHARIADQLVRLRNESDAHHSPVEGSITATLIDRVNPVRQQVRLDTAYAEQFAQIATEGVHPGLVADAFTRLVAAASVTSDADLHPATTLHLVSLFVRSGSLLSPVVLDLATQSTIVPEEAGLVLAATGDTKSPGRNAAWPLASTVIRNMIHAVSVEFGLSDEPLAAQVSRELTTRTWAHGTATAYVVDAVQRVVEAVRAGQLDPQLARPWRRAAVMSLRTDFTQDMRDDLSGRESGEQTGT